jgi:seryl-tRNA synthetase
MGVLEDLGAKKPETRKVEIALDPELGQEWAKAQQALDDARRVLNEARQDSARAASTGGMALLREDIEARQAEVDEAQAKLDAIEEKLRPKMATFVFGSVSPEEFEALKNEHKPTGKQRDEARKAGEGIEWNPETFNPALIAAACRKVITATGTKDGLTPEEVRAAIWDNPAYNTGIRNELFSAALAAYMFHTRVDLGKG